MRLMLPWSIPSGAAITRILILILVPVSFLVAAARPAYCQQAGQLKAAFIYNFAKFVEWPPSIFPDKEASFVIGILEAEPLTEPLEALAGKIVQGRTLVVKRTSRIDDLRKCQIVVLSGADHQRLAPIIGALQSLPVLTVTDEAPNFAQLGAIINLATVEDKIRFQIKVEAAQRAGLKISSQLLKLAIIVYN